MGCLNLHDCFIIGILHLSIKHLKFSAMKKLVLLLSFVFVLGLVGVSAQDKTPAKKEPAKTEQPAKKKVVKAKKGTKKAATTKEAPVKK